MEPHTHCSAAGLVQRELMSTLGKQVVKGEKSQPCRLDEFSTTFQGSYFSVLSDVVPRNLFSVKRPVS